MGILLFDKPFKTYDEQIDILINRYGLIIQNKAFAIQTLQSLTYYDLVNGYKEIFIQEGKFIPNTTIEALYAMYILDHNIQSMLMEYSMIVENSFKTKLAYVISDNFGVFEHEYLDGSNYFKSNGKTKFADVFNACEYLLSHPSFKNQPITHYLKTHNHVPAWILFKNLSFSNSIKLFKLLKPNEKAQVIDLFFPVSALSYTSKTLFLYNSLNIVRNFRNKIAHNLKFITFKDSDNKLQANSIIYLAPKELLKWKDIKKDHRGICDIYAYIICLFILSCDPYLQSIFANAFRRVFSQVTTNGGGYFSYIFARYCDIANIPLDFPQRLDRYMNAKTP